MPHFDLTKIDADIEAAERFLDQTEVVRAELLREKEAIESRITKLTNLICRLMNQEERSAVVMADLICGAMK